ncbi:MAG: sigma-70 family RNA polymerase sigma factor, partial [Pseudomonadota bacterium]
MSQFNYAQAIQSAQQGDLEAFAKVVEAFQDMANGIAYGWLGDSEAARDAGQEAFLEAFKNLQQLQTPEAFPGWFRLIVRKHCDRLTRRKKPEDVQTTSLEPTDTDPADILADNEIRQSVRWTVESLPPAERLVVALHYFAELTGAETSALLDIPLSTVKKRLRTA